ncbi:hypothetical protein EDD18DRAFT_283393 [Armillaria luteobubalina]|uniref:Uncharacterized protein n=1 Tax=Armillaria luteobubalina TaxID=153913 RepID=A0AA39URY7_9AGAR|nr:hypothetical protein EDD18DRAFT_283347 [Armillaria luteobubalina]KAK0494775.1 hypothetical protein EDD18DRAFT_283393 [Armillaria luteobubalina]
MAHTSVDIAAPGIVAPPTKEHLEFLQKWTKAHVKDNNVFVLGPLSPDGIYSFDIVLFGLLRLRGYIDTTSLAFQLEALLHIPILGDISLGEISGSLKDGVTLAIGISGIATGSLRFYLQNTWDLYVDIGLDTIVGDWHTTVFLFTIPH